jgi:hypothetical protein
LPFSFGTTQRPAGVAGAGGGAMEESGAT